jgi:hypothetical protein
MNMFAPAQSFFPSDSLETVIHYAIQDRFLSHTNPDAARKPQVASTFGAPHTSATVEATAFYAPSHPMHDNEPYAALLDFAGSEDNLGKVKITLPHGRFVTRQSVIKYARHDFEVGGTFTPPGWVSHPHSDYLSGSSPIIHLTGTKLWLWFPRTEHNASVMDILSVMATDRPIHETLKQMEGLQWAIMDSPAGFIMDRFEYHGCLSLTSSMHIGGPIWYPIEMQDSCRQIHLKIDNMLSFSRDLATREERKQAFQQLINTVKEYEDALENALRAAELIENEEDRKKVVDDFIKLQQRIKNLPKERVNVVGTTGK